MNLINISVTYEIVAYLTEYIVHKAVFSHSILIFTNLIQMQIKVYVNLEIYKFIDVCR